jgi:hypothetical protein
VNLIVAREDNKDAENVKKFVQAYQSDEVNEAANKGINNKSGRAPNNRKGGIAPPWKRGVTELPAFNGAAVEVFQ